MRKRIPTLIVFLTVLALPATAMAYFAAAGSGTAEATVTYLSVPGSPAAASGTNVTVTWTASTINASVAATSYTVERYSGSGSDLGAASCNPVASSSGNPDAFGSFSCTDSPGAGTYKYKITANYGNSWTATTGFTNTATVKNITSTTAAGPANATTGSVIAASSISSTLSGATSGATGTITFTVFGPQATAPTTCTSGGTTAGTVTVSGNGTYHPSAGYTPSTAGTYWWYASYGGDSNNAASTSTCGSGMSSTLVKNATATTAAAPAGGAAGTAIVSSSISSNLSGATSGATGTITFTVFGPQAAAPTSCTSGGTAVGTTTVSGNGTYSPSAGFTPSAAGNYWWYASYGGDASNAASNSACGSGMAETVVAKASPSTNASAPATDSTNTAISTSSISSTLSGATSGATGTITFTVFGPQASAPTTCASGGTTIGTATISGNGTYHPSTGYTPSSTGTYWWYASYSGDTNNNAANSTCGSGMASTVVKNATTTTASGPATDTVSTTIASSSISSTLAGAASGATGTITFTVFGPQATAPTTCTSGGITVGTAAISGNGTYHPSTGYTPSAAGTYWWYASYSGDTSNSASSSTCGTGMASTVVWSETSAASVTDTTKNGTSSTTSSFIVQPNTTYLLFVFRHSASGDSITSISSTGLSPSLSTSSFTSITSQSFNSSVDYQSAHYVTTASNATGTGTITVSFTTPLPSGGVTIVDLVRLGGNNTSSPIVTTNEKLTTATSTSPTANLPNAPGSQDAEAVFLSGNANLGASAPTATGLTNIFYSAQNAGSTALYSGLPAQQNSSFSAITSQPWGTIALELNHG